MLHLDHLYYLQDNICKKNAEFHMQYKVEPLLYKNCVCERERERGEGLKGNWLFYWYSNFFVNCHSQLLVCLKYILTTCILFCPNV
jgi:hypothetical protein